MTTATRMDTVLRPRATPRVCHNTPDEYVVDLPDLSASIVLSADQLRAIQASRVRRGAPYRDDAWANVELTGVGAPTVEPLGSGLPGVPLDAIGQSAAGYLVGFDLGQARLTVRLEEDDLRQLVASAIIAQAVGHARDTGRPE